MAGGEGVRAAAGGQEGVSGRGPAWSVHSLLGRPAGPREGRARREAAADGSRGVGRAALGGRRWARGLGHPAKSRPAEAKGADGGAGPRSTAVSWRKRTGGRSAPGVAAGCSRLGHGGEKKILSCIREG